MRANWACLGVLCLLFAGPGYARTTVDLKDGETIVVHRLDTGTQIHIDGRLDEAVWQTLPAYDEFRVIVPDTLAKVPFKTLVRIAYNDEGLYVGIDMEQPHDTLIERLSGRDQQSINRDTISLTLDTSGEGRYGYRFGIALGDSLMDGTVLPERNFTSDWDGAWRGATRITKHGWSAEMFIPWGTVAMPSSGEDRHIGLYMSRKVAYIDQRWGWPALPKTQPKFLSVLQPLELKGVNPRQQYSFFPFAAVARDRVESRNKYHVGADFFWRPSSNFQLLGTVNPDFGNVESDDVVINLSATETFFPEKRLFFLEGEEVFNASPRVNPDSGGIGSPDPPVTLLNTRRIGGQPRAVTLVPGVTLSERETTQPVDLRGAVKVTGQLGRFRYGVLGASEDDTVLHGELNGMPFPISQAGSDYAVGRLLYEDSPNGAYRAVGILSTAVLNPDQDALTQGVDGHYRTPNGKWKLDSQVFTSDKDGVPRGYGGFFDVVDTVRQGVSQRMGIEYFDKNVDINDLGYLARNDSLRLRAAHIRTSHNLGWARDNQFDVRGYVQQNTEHLFTGGWVFFADKLTFNNLSSIFVRLNLRASAYDDLNSVGNGTFRIHRGQLAGIGYSSDSSGRFSYVVNVFQGQEDLGDPGYGGGFTLNWRPSSQYSYQFHVDYTKSYGWLVHDSGRDFTTFDTEQWQLNLSADYFLTARQQLRMALQWVGDRAHQKQFFVVPLTPGELIEVAPAPGRFDSFSVGDLSFQVRYRWELAPLSDLFVVYTRTSDRGLSLQTDTFENVLIDSWRHPLTDILVFKVRYRLGS